MRKLTDVELNVYKEYCEEKNKNIKTNLCIYDIVNIDENLTHDVGYSDNIGIVEGYAGIDRYVYVMAYNRKKEEYWVCGFSEHELTKIEDANMQDVNVNLRSNLHDWVYKNEIQFNSEIKERINEKISNKITYIDFKNKKKLY